MDTPPTHKSEEQFPETMEELLLRFRQTEVQGCVFGLSKRGLSEQVSLRMSGYGTACLGELGRVSDLELTYLFNVVVAVVAES